MRGEWREGKRTYSSLDVQDVGKSIELVGSGGLATGADWDECAVSAEL